MVAKSILLSVLVYSISVAALASERRSPCAGLLKRLEQLTMKWGVAREKTVYRWLTKGSSEERVTALKLLEKRGFGSVDVLTKRLTQFASTSEFPHMEAAVLEARRLWPSDGPLKTTNIDGGYFAEGSWISEEATEVLTFSDVFLREHLAKANVFYGAHVDPLLAGVRIDSHQIAWYKELAKRLEPDDVRALTQFISGIVEPGWQHRVNPPNFMYVTEPPPHYEFYAGIDAEGAKLWKISRALWLLDEYETLNGMEYPALSVKAVTDFIAHIWVKESFRSILNMSFGPPMLARELKRVLWLARRNDLEFMIRSRLEISDFDRRGTQMFLRELGEMLELKRLFHEKEVSEDLVKLWDNWLTEVPKPDYTDD